MTQPIHSVAQLSDQALLAEVTTLAQSECAGTAVLIAALAELDTRRLYLGEGCSSLFTYCTQVLHLSEHAAYGRIEAARAARRFPVILEQLAEGSITLTTVCLLAPHLTTENHREVLAAARHRRKREVELLVASLAPRPALPAVVRKRPPRPRATQAAPVEPRHAATSGMSTPTAPPCQPTPQSPHASQTVKRPDVVTPLAPERYKVQFTASRATYEKLRRAQDLLRHTIPNGDVAAVLDRALTVLLADLEKKKVGDTKRPRAGRWAAPRSRHIPAAVRREVWKRDGGRCTFVGPSGRRCSETGLLEFHHVVPFAMGGPTTVESIFIRCRAHNLYEAEQCFGPKQPSLVRELAPPACWVRPGPRGASRVAQELHPDAAPGVAPGDLPAPCRSRHAGT